MSKVQNFCESIGCRYPIIQAGMVWVSGAKLAAASANAGILGIIGAGSMKVDLLRSQLTKAKALAPNGALGINLPLLYHGIEEQIDVALDAGIRIFITSAGSPKLFTAKLKAAGCTVLHVVSNPTLAKKCEDAGVDMVIAEGFEAGGHNGRDELTTMVLLPQVVDAVRIPVIAAGGIACGRQVVASFALGASAVQIGSRYAATLESSAHENFKQAIVKADYSATKLMMKKHVPVRLLRNGFAAQVEALELKGASKEDLENLLGKGRAKKGMLDGDLDEGELEIGQVSGMINDVPSVQDLTHRIIEETKSALNDLSNRTSGLF
jgi:enoyl-[acyl-carrier protein] reductase II